MDSKVKWLSKCVHFPLICERIAYVCVKGKVCFKCFPW